MDNVSQGSNTSSGRFKIDVTDPVMSPLPPPIVSCSPPGNGSIASDSLPPPAYSEQTSKPDEPAVPLVQKESPSPIHKQYNNPPDDSDDSPKTIQPRPPIVTGVAKYRITGW